MIFDWEDFWTLAEKLALDAPAQPAPLCAAMRRTAISRAYYAVFGSAANWLRVHYPTHLLAGHGVIHQNVIDFFLFSSDYTHQDIGRGINRLRGRRNQADYNATIADLENLVGDSLFDANRILNALAGLET